MAGDNRIAHRVMREAVSAAAPARLIRSFVDEGAPVLAILTESATDNLQSCQSAGLFLQEVLGAFEVKRPNIGVAAPAEEGIYGRLSGRELEILALVGCGMRNREIGNRLGLSEGSVKWYTQHVYDKIGIRRRSQAVERARQSA